MKRFGLQEIKDFNKDLLTKEDCQEIKKLKNNEDIIIRRADKSNTFVIMNKTEYETKINKILSDETKFEKII